jgi:hypothetical protein
MGFFSNAKDRMLEGVALSYLNGNIIGPYGRATSLRLDSDARNIQIELELKGETAPVHIEVIGYELTQEGEKYYASAKEIRTSREWLTAVAKDRLSNRRHEIPAHAGRMLMQAL